MRLPFSNPVVTGVVPTTTNAAVTADYLNMGNATRVAVVVTLKQAAAHATPITIRQAQDVSGTGAKDLAKVVPVWANEDVATSDLMTQQDDAVSHTVAADVKNKKVIFQVEGEDLDVENGFDAITVLVGASTEATNFVSIDYIVDARYPDQSCVE